MECQKASTKTCASLPAKYLLSNNSAILSHFPLRSFHSDQTPLKYGYRSAYGPLNRKVHSLAPLSNSTPHIVPLAAAAQLPLATSASMPVLKPVGAGKKKPLKVDAEPAMKPVASLSSLPSVKAPLPPTTKQEAPMVYVDRESAGLDPTNSGLHLASLRSPPFDPNVA